MSDVSSLELIATSRPSPPPSLTAVLGRNTGRNKIGPIVSSVVFRCPLQKVVICRQSALESGWNQVSARASQARGRGFETRRPLYETLVAWGGRREADLSTFKW